MFYSKKMMSKKGPLGTVWVAGVCGVAALTRDQVLRTNVVASVGKPRHTHRLRQFVPCNAGKALCFSSGGSRGSWFLIRA
jgi:hypothetical protein